MALQSINEENQDTEDNVARLSNNRNRTQASILVVDDEETMRDSSCQILRKYGYLVETAKEIDRSPAEVALNWVANRPGVSSTIIGASKPSQLESNLKALNFELPEALIERLDEVSCPDPTELDDFFGPELQGWIRGGTHIRS